MARKKKQPFNPFDMGGAKKQEATKKPTSVPQAAQPKISPHQPPTPVEKSVSRAPIPASYTKQPSEEKSEDDVIEEPEELPPETEETEGPASAAGAGRSLGLRKVEEIVKRPEMVEKSDDERVSDLLAESRQLVDEDEAEKEPIVVEPISVHPDQQIAAQHQPAKKEERRKGANTRRRKRRVHTPAKRVIKLNRRKYMEFKVDLREIMEEENVQDEYRANILGTTWAKGERNGIDEAVEFIDQKVAEGTLPESAAERIRTVLNRYRTAR